MPRPRIFEKLTKLFRDTQRVPFKLDKTQKPLFSQLGTKTKRFFFEKNFGFFSFGKSRTVPKKWQRGTL